MSTSRKLAGLGFEGFGEPDGTFDPHSSYKMLTTALYNFNDPSLSTSGRKDY